MSAPADNLAKGMGRPRSASPTTGPSPPFSGGGTTLSGRWARAGKIVGIAWGWSLVLLWG